MKCRNGEKTKALLAGVTDRMRGGMSWMGMPLRLGVGWGASVRNDALRDVSPNNHVGGAHLGKYQCGGRGDHQAYL